MAATTTAETLPTLRPELEAKIAEHQQQIANARREIDKAAHRELELRTHLESLRTKLAKGDRRANARADKIEADIRTCVRQNHELNRQITDCEQALVPLNAALANFQRADQIAAQKAEGERLERELHAAERALSNANEAQRLAQKTRDIAWKRLGEFRRQQSERELAERSARVQQRPI